MRKRLNAHDNVSGGYTNYVFVCILTFVIRGTMIVFLLLSQETTNRLNLVFTTKHC